MEVTAAARDEKRDRRRLARPDRANEWQHAERKGARREFDVNVEFLVQRPSTLLPFAPSRFEVCAL